MKYLCVLLAMAGLISCNNHSTPAPPSSKIIVKDSAIIGPGTANPYVPVDVSPMDMAYFPTDYALSKMNGLPMEQPRARVIYSRPHRGGRKLFGGLVQWGQPWRLGANEATELQLFFPVTVQDKRLPSGTYIIYSIPYEDHWTIVFNKNIYSWGLKFDPQDDLLRFDVPSTTTARLIEYLTITFEKTAEGANLLMAWENTEVRLPFRF